MRQCLQVMAAGLVCSVCLCDGGRMSAQETAYTFKGNSLGMTLEDFKKQNFHGYVFYDKKGNLTKEGKKGAIQVASPVCTDSAAFAEDPGERVNLVPDEVVCPEDRPQFAGQRFVQVRYRFYRGYLFQIESQFGSSGYPQVKAAFIEKYGPLSEMRSMDYQNGFGASWTGEVSIWRQRNQTIVVTEGPDNGPGQDGCDYRSPDSGDCLVPKLDATAILRDNSVAPAKTAAKPDF